MNPQRLSSLLLLLCATLTTGCALETTALPSPVDQAQIRGTVYGGQQAVVGSHVYVMGISTAAFGGNGIAASTANAAVSLLKASKTGLSDSVGAYVLTVTGGNFAIGGDYTCTQGQQVYLYVTGGNSGYGTNNSSIGLMALLGTCSSSQNFASQVPFLTVNEATTVAAAYALAGFATDPTHIGDDEGASGNTTSASAVTGLTNAVANAFQLVRQTDGVAYSTTPTGGIAPVQAVNTVADILAACVNGTGDATTTTANCYKLFHSAPNGSTLPTDTATAAINIAHNPGLNVSALYDIISGVPPFLPQFTSAPNDFALGIQYTAAYLDGDEANLVVDASGNAYATDTTNGYNGGGTVTKWSAQGQLLSNATYGLTGTATTLANPANLSIDPANGNVWITSPYTDRLIVTNASGTLVSPAAGYDPDPGNNTSIAYSAFDSSGNLWGANVYDADVVIKMNSNGNVLSGSGYASGALSNGTHGISADGSGHIWIANYGSNSVVEVNSNGTYNTYTNSNLNQIFNIATDANGAAWLPDYNGNLNKFGADGSTQLFLSAVTMDAIWANAVDGGNNMWVIARDNELVQFDTNGNRVPLTGASLNGNALNAPVDMALDASGNCWILNAGNYLTQMIGVTRPVVMPMGLAAMKNKIGQLP